MNIVRRGTIIVSIVFLLLPRSVGAQEETPTKNEKVIVSGVIINRTTGEPVPEGLRTMLHRRDENGSPLAMLHGVSGPQGSFAFNDVEVDAGMSYGVMVIYEEATYFSGLARADAAGELPPFEVDVYETTENAHNVRIENLGVLLGFGQGGLAVTEIYTLSNLGDRTVARSAALESGERATMVFSLPDGAVNKRKLENRPKSRSALERWG